MKKIVIVFSLMFFCLFFTMFLIVNNDQKNILNMSKKIIKNTDISSVEYINYYDNYYIVKDMEKLYLFNNEYKELLSINLNLLFNNIDNYDIVYKNKTLMYMKSNKNKKGIIFSYYDIYTGECIDKIVIGENL